MTYVISKKRKLSAVDIVERGQKGLVKLKQVVVVSCVHLAVVVSFGRERLVNSSSVTF